jgi:hypothetical protein
MKPICVPCQRFFRCKKTGFFFIEGMPVGQSRAAPGTTEPENWKPYKLWSGDRFECEGCGANIVVGVGQSAIAEHYEPDFSESVEDYGAKLQVNDC